MLAVVAGAAGPAVAAVENGDDRREFVDEVSSGFPENCSSLSSRSCRCPSATWYSSHSRYPCPIASYSNFEAAGPAPAFGNTPVDFQCSCDENCPFGSWR